MDVLVTCKYEEDPIKKEGARVVTTLYSKFSDAQGLGLPRLQIIENVYRTCHTRHASVYTHPYGTLLQIYRKMINKSIKHIKIPVSRISVLLKRHIPRIAFNQYGF